MFPEKGWRETLVTIWHKDPCKGPGGDDTCGWFKRPHHGNQEHYAKIKKEFAFDWDNASKYDDGRPMFLGWFHPSGEPLYSNGAIALHFFHRAALIHFEGNNKKVWRFMRKYHYDIIAFSENPIDSMINTIQNKYNEKRENRINSMAGMVYGCILRWEQKWWQHPRWHIHHWRIQAPIFSAIKRWMVGKFRVPKTAPAKTLNETQS